MKFASILCICFLTGSALAQSDSVRVMRSTATSSPTIDGRLEAEWWKTAAQTGFTQLNPTEGAPSTQRTEVRVMHSTSALYVAFRCYDSDPSKINSTLTKHDRLGEGDQVTFYLDPYHDHRTGYFFSTNPCGVQQEGLFYNDDWMDTSWDGLWDVAVSRDDSGWTAEMKIPFSTLRFNNKVDSLTWGVNAQRYIWRNKESAYWQPVTRDKGRRVSGFGHLEGMTDLNPGRGLEMRPYAVADFQQDQSHPLHGDNDWNNLGIDAKYRLAPNLTVDATLNPDFAQIEADDEVINMSAYPVYLQEKRPFFLEGATIFDTPVELFYSRRITDPDAGAKVSGKIGSVKLMALTARNRTQNQQAEDFGVLRLKQDVLKSSEVGMLLTDKQGPGGNYARVWSADTRLQFSQQSILTSMVGQSFKPGLSNQNLLHRLGYMYYTDKYSFQLLSSGMMRDFNANDAGFVKYSNYQRWEAYLEGNARPEKGGWRRINTNFELGYETEYSLRYPRVWMNANVNFTTMNYMYPGFGWFYSWTDYWRQYVDEGEPYDDRDNFGHYVRERFDNNSEYWMWFETDFSRPLAFSANYDLGTYREGYQHSASGTVQVRPFSNLETSLRLSHTHVANVPDINNGLGQDYFVGRFKVEWTLTTKIFTRLNVQYVYGSEVYLTNALLGYNFAPQSWFYLVYDDQKDNLLGWQEIQDRRIKMKVSYFVKV